MQCQLPACTGRRTSASMLVHQVVHVSDTHFSAHSPIRHSTAVDLEPTISEAASGMADCLERRALNQKAQNGLITRSRSRWAINYQWPILR